MRKIYGVHHLDLVISYIEDLDAPSTRYDL